MKLEKISGRLSEKQVERAEEFRKRMCEWANPVEFVNNMYGCHPNPCPNSEGDYFTTIFS